MPRTNFRVPLALYLVTCSFSYKKEVYRKMRLKRPISASKIKCLLLIKNPYYIIITFKILEEEFKFEYTR